MGLLHFKNKHYVLERKDVPKAALPLLPRTPDKESIEFFRRSLSARMSKDDPHTCESIRTHERVPLTASKRKKRKNGPEGEQIVDLETESEAEPFASTKSGRTRAHNALGSDMVVACRFNIEITEQDMRTLDGTSWLNDKVSTVQWLYTIRSLLDVP